MRRRIRAARCVIVLAMFMASIGRAGEPDGLVAYYPFNGNANDASGNGHNGVVYGPVLTTDRNGTADSAYSFNGVDDYIIVPYSSVFNSDAFTISAWICPSRDLSVGTGAAVIAAQGEDFANDLLSWSLEIVNAGNSWGTGATVLYEDSHDAEQVFDTGYYPEVGAWSQITATRSPGDEISLYIDGMLIGHWLGTRDPATCTQDLTIGARWWSPSSSGPYSLQGFFSGSLDDISLYDRALTAGEIGEMLSYALTISSTTGGSVTVPGEGTFTYAHGASIPVTATAEAHSHFTGWTGTAVGAGKVTSPSSSSTDVTVDEDYGLQANFVLDQHSLMVAADGSGSVTGAGTYDWGSTVPVRATASINHHFVNWTATGFVTVADSTSADTTVTIDGNGGITAHFAIDQRTLTISSTDGGAVDSPGVGSFQYDHGSVASIAATPEAHHHFVKWTGTAVDAGKVDAPASASTSVTMDADYTLQAEFEIDTHTLMINAAEGSVTCDPSKSEYPYGTTVALHVTANSGYRFTNWSGDLSGSDNPATIPMDSDKVVTANFIILRNLVISATAGGVVTSPGEGTFVHDDGTAVSLEAQAHPLFKFVGWRGGIFTDTTPYPLAMDADYNIEACFESILDVIYVDDDAPSDPGPGDPNISDPLENGTAERPFDRIQEAIDVARESTQILVHGGVYYEQLNFMGKNVSVQGLRLIDPNATEEPVVDGHGTGPVVTFSGGENANCMLAGLRIQGGQAANGAAILCQGSPTIANCLIAGNLATGLQGAAIHCVASDAAFINCTITENMADPSGTLMKCRASSITLSNCILWGNEPPTVWTISGEAPTMSYCDVEEGWAGPGNMNMVPAFVAPGSWTDTGVLGWRQDDTWLPGDYHLLSEAGHWDAATRTRVKDATTSPCIDAGDPNIPVGLEPVPNGSRINLGVYGGTNQASISANGE